MAIALEVAAAMLNALTAQLDMGADAGYVEIRSGSMPVGTNEFTEDSDCLATIILNSPAFYLADTNPQRGVAQADAVVTPSLTDANCRATGDATWFRAFDSNDRPILDGSIGTIEADMLVVSARIEADKPFTITSWAIQMPVS